MADGEKGYHVVYDIHKDGIPAGEIPEGKGGTDALLFISIVRSEGGVSYAITGVDGVAEDGVLSGIERWKVWLQIAHDLMVDKTLGANKRDLCRGVFEAVQQAIMAARSDEEAGAGDESEETRQTRTREVLLLSAVWKAETAKCGVLELADAGPLPMTGWSEMDHRAVRLWALGGIAEMPGLVDDYFRDRVRRP